MTDSIVPAINLCSVQSYLY